VATVASIALVLAPLAPTRVMAFAATASPTAAPTALSAPAEAAVSHLVFARIDDASFLATYLPVDAPLLDEPQLQAFRVRFHVDNATTDPITLDPQLEYRPDGGDGYIVVPQEPQAGEAFQVAREWVSGPGGPTQSPLGADIAVTDLMVSDDSGDLAVSGHHSMGLNPDLPIILPANSYTEQEFTVQLTVDAQHLSGYDLRITDAGTALTGTAIASVRVSARPALPAAAGQPPVVTSSSPVVAAPSDPGAAASSDSKGSTSSDPKGSTSSDPKGSTSSDPKAPPKTAVSSLSTMRYALAPGAVSAAALSSSGIHGPYSLTTDQCAICHRAHTAKGPNLLTKAAPQSNLCFTCHDGTGAPATLDVKSQYAAIPANVVTSSTRDYYSHDVQAPTTHTLSSDKNEFAGVSNRHSECADCHNPHDANSATVSTQTPTGWTASARVSGTSGVSVVNGAGTAPTYTFVPGQGNPLTREYELCFKCHSGFTTLPSNNGFAPSSALLDKGAEFDPNNASFHPIEAPGTNQTDAMKASLAGSPFATTDTIRCSNCHAGPGQSPPVTPPTAGSDLAPHASQFQGILLQSYRSRVLEGRGASYQDADFALCLMCHAKAPFATSGTDPATNFGLHGKHMTALDSPGNGGNSIDTPGDGQGNAICAECHFRLHSTTFQVPGQTLDGSRLVNFSPNVQPNVPGEKISWTPSATGGSCTLTCHGHEHAGSTY
jgi:predicted CXXCH cytochrome family protein